MTGFGGRDQGGEPGELDGGSGLARGCALSDRPLLGGQQCGNGLGTGSDRGRAGGSRGAADRASMRRVLITKGGELGCERGMRRDRGVVQGDQHRLVSRHRRGDLGVRVHVGGRGRCGSWSRSRGAGRCQQCDAHERRAAQQSPPAQQIRRQPRRMRSPGPVHDGQHAT